MSNSSLLTPLYPAFFSRRSSFPSASVNVAEVFSIVPADLRRLFLQ